MLILVALLGRGRGGGRVAGAQLSGPAKKIQYAAAALSMLLPLVDVVGWLLGKAVRASDWVRHMAYPLWGLHFLVFALVVEVREKGVLLRGSLVRWSRLRSWEWQEEQGSGRVRRTLLPKPGRFAQRPTVISLDAQDRSRVDALLRERVGA